MGVNKILAIAGYQDIAVLRNQALSASNSTFKLVKDGAAFSMTSYTTITFEIYSDPNFQVASPVVSLTKAAGKIVAQSTGFYLNTAAADLDIEGKVYYYTLKGDGVVLLTGKFTVVEHAETL